MQLVEIRDLDGPNLFALFPIIKLEVSVDSGEVIADQRRDYVAEHFGFSIPLDPLQALKALISEIHAHLDAASVDPEIHEMDTPGHYAICFPWTKRAVARAIARTAYDLLAGEHFTELDSYLVRSIQNEIEDEDQSPTWVRDSERTIPAAAVTGTNGKTTTTRFLAHILNHAGKRVGWSSSSGVYIEGKLVIDGDYTGHGGARRVLTDPDVDCAVLETARGGILLRGLGFESNDVSVFLNISEDHLNLHGVRSLETLARVKGTVIRTTRPDGTVVLNADDPLVLAQRTGLRANVLLFSQLEDNAAIARHLRAGGSAVTLERGVITYRAEGKAVPIVEIVEVPLSYGGMARHMIENSLAACAAALALKLDPETVGEAMRTFHPDRDHNAGRLNVFELNGFIFIVDFAHNESGLRFLLDFARHLMPDASRLTAIVGTAGDRQDSVFVGLGRIAGEHADRILVKTNPGYLRGRTPEQTVGLILKGLEEAERTIEQDEIYSSEHEAAVAAIESAEWGEVIVIMCVEDYLKIIDELVARGATERRTTYA